MPIKKPFVNLFVCVPNTGGDGYNYSLLNLTVGGDNVASSKYLVSFKYEYESEGEDSASITLNFNSHNLNLNSFREGVRVALVFGYEGAKRSAVRDMVIKTVKGRYTTSGYTITLNLVPTMAWLDQYSYEGGLDEQLASMGAHITYQYYNQNTGENLNFKYSPSDNSMVVDGQVKDRYTKPTRPKVPEVTWPLRTVAEGYAPAPGVNTQAGNIFKKWVEEPAEERSAAQRKHIYEKTSEAMLRMLNGMAVQPKGLKRDDEFKIFDRPETAASVRYYTVGPHLTLEKCISFSFEAGEAARSEDQEAELQIHIMDASSKETGGVKIDKLWRIINPETRDFQTFEVVKVNGDYFYKVQGFDDRKLSLTEVARLKKVQEQENYSSYLSGEREINSSGNTQRRDPQSPGAAIFPYIAADADNYTTKNVISHNPNLPAKALLNQVIPTSGQTDISTPGAFTSQFVKSYVKRVSINASSKEELLGKMVRRKLDAIFSNLTCDITVEGDPYLEAPFTFNISNAGYPVNGKFLATKVTQTISGGKYVTTISGAKVPAAIDMAVAEASESIDKVVSKIEHDYRVYDKIGRAFNIEMGPSNGVSSISNLFDRHTTGGIGSYSSDVGKSPSITPTPNKRTTHVLSAGSADELQIIRSDPKKLTQLQELDIQADKAINQRAKDRNSSIDGAFDEVRKSQRTQKPGVLLDTKEIEPFKKKRATIFTTIPDNIFKADE